MIGCRDSCAVGPLSLPGAIIIICADKATVRPSLLVASKRYEENADQYLAKRLPHHTDATPS
jgi:hypothetical protein